MAFSLDDFDHISEFRLGGTAKVYRAVQKSLNRTVVIKELTCSPAEEAVQKKRFENEARSAAALDHDNIIRIYDFGEKGSSYYITMEYIDGPDFEELLKYPGFPVKTSLSIILQALKGIRFSHRNATVHRDIKPANILVSRDGRVKVADFGLAHAGHSSLSLTASGMMVGTPQYMSPEQVNGSREKDPRMDIWAAGVLLYRVLTGNHPFEGASLPAMVYSIVYTKETDIRRLLPDLPEDLAQCICRCLEKEPGNRLPSLDPLISALQDYLFSLGVRDPAEEIALHPAVRGAQTSLDGAQDSIEPPTTHAVADIPETTRIAPETVRSKKVTRPASIAAVAVLLIIALIIAVQVYRTETSGLIDRREVVGDTLHSPQTIDSFEKPTAEPDRKASDTAIVRATPRPVSRGQGTRRTEASSGTFDTTGRSLSVVVESPTPVVRQNPSPEPPATAVPTPSVQKRTSTGELHVMTFPSRVDIIIDGTALGMTPLQEPLRIPTGKRELVLRKSGYTEFRETIDITPNTLKRVRARLERIGSGQDTGR